MGASCEQKVFTAISVASLNFFALQSTSQMADLKASVSRAVAGRGLPSDRRFSLQGAIFQPAVMPTNGYVPNFLPSSS